MYLTGTQFNLQKRIHQLAANSGDVNSFIVEKNSYTDLASLKDINYWEKEIIKKKSIFGL